MKEREYTHIRGGHGPKERRERNQKCTSPFRPLDEPPMNHPHILALVAHIPPLSSPRSHNYDLVCPFQRHFSPVLSLEKSYGFLVRFPRHFSELLLPLDPSETLTLSIYLFSIVLSLSRMINSREIKSCLRILMLSKLIFDNIIPPLKTIVVLDYEH